MRLSHGLPHNRRPIAVDSGVRGAEPLVILKTTYDDKLEDFPLAQLFHKQALENIFQHPCERLALTIALAPDFVEWPHLRTQNVR
jgi:hypothetical protein